LALYKLQSFVKEIIFSRSGLQKSAAKATKAVNELHQLALNIL